MPFSIGHLLIVGGTQKPTLVQRSAFVPSRKLGTQNDHSFFGDSKSKPFRSVAVPLPLSLPSKRQNKIAAEEAASKEHSSDESVSEGSQSWGSNSSFDYDRDDSDYWSSPSDTDPAISTHGATTRTGALVGGGVGGVGGMADYMAKWGPAGGVPSVRGGSRGGGRRRRRRRNSATSSVSTAFSMTTPSVFSVAGSTMSRGGGLRLQRDPGWGAASAGAGSLYSSPGYSRERRGRGGSLAASYISHGER